jgi:hypothetical protein
MVGIFYMITHKVLKSWFDCYIQSNIQPEFIKDYCFMDLKYHDEYNLNYIENFLKKYSELMEYFI